MHKLLGAALLCSALTGCAGMNSDFDCNATATDKCLTTAEANALAAKGKSGRGAQGLALSINIADANLH